MKHVLSSLVVLVLMGASIIAVRHAIADEVVASINGRLFELGRVQAQTGVAPDEATIQQLAADAKSALRLAPGNGHYWNALARVHYTPRTNASGAVVTDIDAAYIAAKAAVINQPSSGYAWGSLAFASDQLMVQNRLPGGQIALAQSLARAAALGAAEPQVLRNVVDLGFADWDQLSVPGRQSVMQSVNHLALHHADDAVALALRRGKLAEACMEKRLASQKACAILVNVNAISS